MEPCRGHQTGKKESPTPSQGRGKSSIFGTDVLTGGQAGQLDPFVLQGEFLVEIRTLPVHTPFRGSSTSLLDLSLGKWVWRHLSLYVLLSSFLLAITKVFSQDSSGFRTRSRAVWDHGQGSASALVREVPGGNWGYLAWGRKQSEAICAHLSLEDRGAVNCPNKRFVLTGT